MKIKMLTTDGKYKKGETYSPDEKEAIRLLTFGKAVRVKDKPIPAPAPKKKTVND